MNKQLFNEVCTKLYSLEININKSYLLSNLFIKLYTEIDEYLESRYDRTLCSENEIELLLIIKLFLLSLESK
jgi:hypothetical protein